MIKIKRFSEDASFEYAGNFMDFITNIDWKSAEEKVLKKINNWKSNSNIKIINIDIYSKTHSDPTECTVFAKIIYEEN